MQVIVLKATRGVRHVNRYNPVRSGRKVHILKNAVFRSTTWTWVESRKPHFPSLRMD